MKILGKRNKSEKDRENIKRGIWRKKKKKGEVYDILTIFKKYQRTLQDIQGWNGRRIIKFSILEIQGCKSKVLRKYKRRR